MAKEVTRERAQTMLDRAREGSRRLGLDDVADRYDGMSLDDYIEEKGLTIVEENPTVKITKTTREELTMSVAAEPGEGLHPDVSGWKRDDLIEEVRGWQETGNEIWALTLAVEDGEMSAEDAVEEIASFLNEHDDSAFPLDDESEEEGDGQDQDGGDGESEN